MNEQATEYFHFESRETFELAKKESEVIKKIVDSTDLSNAKIALQVYNKAVSDKMFSTVSGYFFLLELRQKIVDSGLVSQQSLYPIPIKEPKGKKKDVISASPAQERRFRKLYEGQKILNKKLKIVIAALVVLVIGFVFVNFKFEYTIFTYFTNYKANMEEELVDKYEKWETDLKAREEKLKQNNEQLQE